jgi:AAA domain
MTTTPEIRTFGDVVLAVWPGLSITIEFSRFTEHRDSLSAEVSVSNEVGLLHWSRINLASATGRNAVVRALEDVHPIEGWRGMLDRACQAVAHHLRTGEPAQEIVMRQATEDAYLVTPWVPLNEITVFYGPGGTAKSLFCLATAIAGLMGHMLGSPWAVGHIAKVLYLDWESDKEAHDRRAWQLLHLIETLPPGRLFHKRLRRPLTDMIPDVRAEAFKLGITCVIIDSLGAASGNEPETAGAALGTLQAVGSLPGTKWVIAHESKAALEQSRGTPFGSVYVWNTARSCIEIRPQDSDDASRLVVTLRHAKNNNGPKAQPLGLTFTFDDAITLSRTKADPATQTLRKQILDALRRSPGMSVTPLAELLNAKPESVRRVLYRLTDDEKVSQVPGVNGQEAAWYLRDT